MKEQKFTTVTLDRESNILTGKFQYYLRINGKSFAKLHFDPSNSDILVIDIDHSAGEEKGIRVNEFDYSYGKIILYLSGFGGKDVETIEVD